MARLGEPEDGHWCVRAKGPVGKGAERLPRAKSRRRTRGMKLLIPHRPNKYYIKHRADSQDKAESRRQQAEAAKVISRETQDAANASEGPATSLERDSAPGT